MFSKILENRDGRPLFVHCVEGRDCTGYSIATYRMLVERCSVDDTLHEMFDFRFNTIWFRNPAFLRQLDVTRMRELVQRVP